MSNNHLNHPPLTALIGGARSLPPGSAVEFVDRIGGHLHGACTGVRADG